MWSLGMGVIADNPESTKFKELDILLHTSALESGNLSHNLNITIVFQFVLEAILLASTPAVIAVDEIRVTRGECEDKGAFLSQHSDVSSPVFNFRQSSGQSNQASELV